MPSMQARDTHDICQETHEFECTLCECIGTRPQIGVVIEQVRQVMLQHPATGTRRHNHVVVATECVEDGFAKVTRRVPITGIIGWLTTAGLRTRQFDLAAEPACSSNCSAAKPTVGR